MSEKKESRLRRAKKTRMRIRDLQVKDITLVRVVVSKSSKHISAEAIVIVDPQKMNTRVVACASTMEKDIKSQCKYTGNIDAAKIVGKTLAERLKQHTTKVAFDRSGYQYHGRIKALADAARESGLDF